MQLKQCLEGKSIAVSTIIVQKKRSQINNLTLCLKAALENKSSLNLNQGRIIKIRAQSSRTENRKQWEKINKSKNGFFKKIELTNLS